MSDTPRTDLVPCTPDNLERYAERLTHLAMTLERENTALRAQLPKSMEHCTILFKECSKGHGWLTATNWEQHGCPTCERNALLVELGRGKPEEPDDDLYVGAIVVLKPGYGEYFCGGEIGTVTELDGSWIKVDRVSAPFSRSYARLLNPLVDRVTP